MPLVVTKESLSEDLKNDDVSYSPYITSKVQVWKHQAWLVWLLVTSRTFSQPMCSCLHQIGISFLLTARGGVGSWARCASGLSGTPPLPSGVLWVLLAPSAVSSLPPSSAHPMVM